MVLGKLVRRPAKLDRQLARDLKALAHHDDPYDTAIGKTMCSNDFYEGQGRLDGAFCEFTETDKIDYLTKLQKAGVANIEMESVCFAALTHYAGIQSAVVCVTLLDRLKGDQVNKSCLAFSSPERKDVVPHRDHRFTLPSAPRRSLPIAATKRQRREIQANKATQLQKFTSYVREQDTIVFLTITCRICTIFSIEPRMIARRSSNRSPLCYI